tara:strand:- start:209 stop:418 length:210 start_codon:yes stop_codon:yes gene_type:complete
MNRREKLINDLLKYAANGESDNENAPDILSALVNTIDTMNENKSKFSSIITQSVREEVIVDLIMAHQNY